MWQEASQHMYQAYEVQPSADSNAQGQPKSDQQAGDQSEVTDVNFEEVKVNKK